MAQWIVFLLFAGFGVTLGYVGVTQWFLQRTILSAARPVEATITRSEVLESRSIDSDRRTLRDNSTMSYRPEVRFTYEVEGKSYESDQLYPTIIVQGYASRDSAAAELIPFPLGAKVSAHVDPAHPDKAFLIAQRSAAPTVFIIVGLALIPIAWFGSKLV